MLRLPPFCLLLLLASLPAAAQTPCALAPLTIPVVTDPVAFTEQQESDLGDAMAEHLRRHIRIVDAATNDYLQLLGERILRQLPPTSLRFRFGLMDYPDVNAFALPGGRIYVSRKVVAFSRSEDELAGVLAHEIGHVVTREVAAHMTRYFRDAIGVTRFADRRDIFDKYHRLVESQKGGGFGAGRLEHGQYGADALALAALARAGYSPDAYIDLFDRYAETRRRTGNIFTNFFNITAPASRRLREMLKAVSVVPDECRIRGAAVSERFLAWQRQVVTGSAGAPEALVGVIAEQRLTPPLQSEITHLRFSPDGRYVLVQDESAIHVLARDPFQVLFRVDVDGAEPAWFTPDSRELVFYTEELRVERWNVEARTRTEVRELSVRIGCLQVALDPSGRRLACLDALLGLRVIDVGTGDLVFRRKSVLSIVIPSLWGTARGVGGGQDTRFRYYRLRFSPDARHVIASDSQRSFVLDLETRGELEVPESLRRAFRQSYDFLDATRVVTVDPARADRSALLQFPSGEVLKTLTLTGTVMGATRTDHVMLRPFLGWPLAVVNLNDGRVVAVNKTASFDVFGDTQIADRATGEVALYPLDSSTPLAVTTLPAAALGKTRAAAVSPDLRWLGLSGRQRGAAWDLRTGVRTPLFHGFRGAYLTDSGLLFADFPARHEVRDGVPTMTPRSIVRVDLATGRAQDQFRVDGHAAVHAERYVLTMTAEKPGRWDEDVTVSLREVTSGATLWSRRFARDVPVTHIDSMSGRVVYEWSLRTRGAKDALKGDKRLRRLADTRTFRERGILVEVREAADGALAGRLLLDLDPQTVAAITSVGDLLVTADVSGQIGVYSLSTGELRGNAFGHAVAVSEPAGLIAVQNEPTELDLYDLVTIERRRTLRFSSPVRFHRFSADGTRLLVVTADQTARILSAEAIARTEE